MARQDANEAFAATSFLYGANAPYLEHIQERYRRDPKSVDPATRRFFENWTPPPEGGTLASPQPGEPKNLGTPEPEPRNPGTPEPRNRQEFYSRVTSLLLRCESITNGPSRLLKYTFESRFSAATSTLITSNCSVSSVPRMS